MQITRKGREQREENAESDAQGERESKDATRGEGDQTRKGKRRTREREEGTRGDGDQKAGNMHTR